MARAGNGAHTLPRVKPGVTGWGDAGDCSQGRLCKKLIPALSVSPILPLTTPRIWTQALRTFGRDRFGFLTGRRGEGPKRTDGRMWIKGVSGPPIQSLPRRTGETRRGSEGTG